MQMIISPSNDTILSSLGWVERGAIWCLRPNHRDAPELIQVANEHITLSVGTDGYFTVSYFDDGLVAQIRHFDSPGLALVEARIDDVRAHFSGDASLFAFGKQDYLPYFMCKGKATPYYVAIDPASGTVNVKALTWFQDLPLDHGYQGPIDILPTPDFELKWIPIARSSDVLRYDVAKNAVDGWLALGDRGGNPKIQQVGGGWLAMDYDTLVEIDITNSGAKRSILIQPETSTEVAPGYRVPSRQFAGDCFVARLSAYVARPFSGDVAVVNLDRLEIDRTIPVGGQPLEIVCTEGQVYTRDWQTGELRVAPL